MSDFTDPEIGYDGSHFPDTNREYDELTAVSWKMAEDLIKEQDALQAQLASARKVISACEENLRLTHEAAGPLPRSSRAPEYSTYGAWDLATRWLEENPK